MSPVAVKCPGCQAKLGLKGDRPQGKAVKCPKCGRSFTPTIPPVSVKCPGCQAKLHLKGKPPQGKAVKCPKCNRSFQVGKAASAKPREQPTLQQEKPDEIPLAPQQEKLDEIPLAPQQGKLDEIPLAPQQEKPDEIPLAPQQEKLDEIPLAPLESAATGLDDNPVSNVTLPPLATPKATKEETREKTEEPKKPKKPREPISPLLQTSIIGGACALLLAIGAVVFIMFQPPGAVGSGSSHTKETPKEFVEVEFGEKEYKCEYPKGWEVTTGGGKDGIPPWAKISKGGASINVRDSVSGTPGGMIKRGNHMGTPVEQGTAPVDEVHEHRKIGVAQSMRSFKESAPQELDHALGAALIAEFTSTPLFGGKIRGYHVTILHEFHQFTIVCRCSAAEWEMLEPAFKHTISTLEPIKRDELFGF